MSVPTVKNFMIKLYKRNGQSHMALSEETTLQGATAAANQKVEEQNQNNPHDPYVRTEIIDLRNPTAVVPADCYGCGAPTPAYCDCREFRPVTA